MSANSERIPALIRHSAEPDAPASAVDDRKKGENAPLTRRELREREREALSAREVKAAELAPEPADLAQPAATLPPSIPELTTSTAVIAVIDSAAKTHTTEIQLPAASALPDTERLATRQEPNQEPQSDERLSERRAARRNVVPQSSKPSVKSASKPTHPASVPASARRAHRTSHSTSARAESARPAAPAWTPSRSIAAPAASSRATGRIRGMAARGASVAVLAVVALLAVSTSLPAAALLSSADVQTAARASTSTTTPAGQTINVAGGDTLTVHRDGYESKSIAEVAAASGIRLEATFTNNPNGTIQWPFAVGVHIGDQFGHRDCAGCSVNHGGQDFNPGIGAPIQAIADGVVSRAEDGEGSLGVHMMIDHVIDGKTVTSVYAHMIHGSMLFKTGDVVKVGQVIGKTGNTGMSTGPHLHFEIRLGGINGTKTNPLVWLRENTN